MPSRTAAGTGAEAAPRGTGAAAASRRRLGTRPPGTACRGWRPACRPVDTQATPATAATGCTPATAWEAPMAWGPRRTAAARTCSSTLRRPRRRLSSRWAPMAHTERRRRQPAHSHSCRTETAAAAAAAPAATPAAAAAATRRATGSDVEAHEGRAAGCGRPLQPDSAAAEPPLAHVGAQARGRPRGHPRASSLDLRGPAAGHARGRS
mmetsp:Transcript_98591/g.274424  ORF Transcript_98591/g.274424 Transcript_98591/m.274424 type:complete len:208 (+) Transcript_98591:471-1094(+)